MKKLAIVCMTLTAGILFGMNTPFQIKGPGEYPFGKVTFQGKVDIGKGISNHALLFKKVKQGSYAQIQMDNFPAEKGSISFWISPKEWESRDGLFHIFLSLSFAPDKEYSKKEVTIYRYGNPDTNSTGLGICLFFSGGTPEKNLILNLPNIKIGESWKKGSWHYIVYNFDSTKGKSEFYIDDELVAVQTRAPKFDKKATITLGPVWGSPAATMLDRVAVRPQTMTKEEISNEYETEMSKFGGKS